MSYFPTAGAFGSWYGREDRYQMTVFPNGRATLDAVDSRGRVFTIQGATDGPGWDQSQCRAYAAEAGFNREENETRDGLTVVIWTAPDA